MLDAPCRSVHDKSRCYTDRRQPIALAMNLHLLLPAAALLALLASASAPAQQTTSSQANACPPLLDHEFSRLQTGKPESLCQYRGKVLLIVNTASYCGYTHQYEGLEAMYRKYKDRGLVVLGFPSNDFGAQEPGSNKEIAEFCRLTYGVQFPMFEKSSVKNLQSNPLYSELREKTGQVPKWNFFKYVIDRNGRPAGAFASAVEPDNRDLTSLVEKLLSEKPVS
jgi:glutathione peroxidase